MMQYWSHAKYTLIHKWYVFIECSKRGIIWRGIKHDMSKFLPSEFFAYANFFFNPDGTRRPKGINSGLSSQQIADCDRAWVHHVNWNDHHYNYWVEDPHNSISIKDVVNKRQAVIMPLPVMKEMISDMIGASKAQGHPDPEIGARDFFYDHKDRIILHPVTQAWMMESFDNLMKKKIN